MPLSLCGIIPHMDLIDIGVNLTGSAFKNDLPEVIARAQQAGVSSMIVTGTDVQHSEDAVRLCAEYAGVLTATTGVHPHHADDYDSSTSEQIAELLVQDAVVAVGECGLDYNRNFSQPRAQRYAFEQQLELAKACGKPVFLHQRDAHEDFFAMMQDAMPDLQGGVAHCFTGTPAQAEAYLDIGLYIGITGWICDERRACDLQQAAGVIPLNRCMLETDAPYLLPRDLPADLPEIPDYHAVDKRRNEPCYLPHVCRAVAAYMSIEADAVAQASTVNARTLFNI